MATVIDHGRVAAESAFYGIKRAACGGAVVAELIRSSRARWGRSRSLRAACGRARAGRPGGRDGDYTAATRRATFSAT